MRNEQARLGSHRNKLEELAILARREAYFTLKEIKKHAQPQPSTRVNPEGEVRQSKRQHDHLDIRRLMRAWAPGTIFVANAEERAIAADEWLRHYLKATDSAITRGGTDAQAPSSTLSAVKSVSADKLQGTQKNTSGSEVGKSLALDLSIPAGKAAKCIICRKMFLRRPELTRHVAATHKEILQKAFPCPICQKVTSTPSEFSNHVEREHGKQFAPHFPRETVAKPVAIKVLHIVGNRGAKLPDRLCVCQLPGTVLCSRRDRRTTTTRRDFFGLRRRQAFKAQHSALSFLPGRSRSRCKSYLPTCKGEVCPAYLRHNTIWL